MHKKLKLADRNIWAYRNILLEAKGFPDNVYWFRSVKTVAMHHQETVFSVDDASTKDFLGQKLDDYISTMEKMSIVRIKVCGLNGHWSTIPCFHTVREMQNLSLNL